VLAADSYLLPKLASLALVEQCRARMRLRDKSIVVIGGTSGIGLSAALALAREGARLVIVGRGDESVTAARTKLGPSVPVLEADATEPESATQSIALAVQQFGRLDGLFHVAGGSGRKFGDGPLHEITDAGWSETLRLNLSSVFYSNRAAIQQFLKQGSGGAILNLGSVLGSSPSPKFFATHAYATAKGAIVALTTAAAAHYAAHNIRCNVLAPSLVATPMSRRAQESTEILQFIRSKQPLDGGRIGQPEDIKGAVVFLLSDEARFITGQVLAVDGGWQVSEGQWKQA
jgi:NAD(P)-dependent dehydrogenase (short-subunit alcohol dehydrogenase family)